MEDVKTGADITLETEIAKPGTGRDTNIASEKTEIKEESDCVCRRIPTDLTSPSDDNQSEPTFTEKAKHVDPSAKPLLSYVALIAKVILSSLSQKLNLAAIYQAIEEQYPYFRNRGQGWRNSVRHNLSLNSCFVKVSRCEDGKGHHWGIHPAHLGDFLLGDFKQHRKAKRSRQERKLQGSWIEALDSKNPYCLWEGFCGSGAELFSLVPPNWPLLESRSYVTTPVEWTGPLFHPWKLHKVESLGLVTPYFSPDMFPNTLDRPVRGEWYYSQSMNPTWTHCVSGRCVTQQWPQ